MKIIKVPINIHNQMIMVISYHFLFQLLPKNAVEGMVKKYGLIVKLDYYGDVIKSYHDPDGSAISKISEVYEDPNEKGVLYLGSFKNNFLGKLKLNSKQDV